MSRTAVKVKKNKKISMPQLKTKAKKLGLDPGKMKKTELIQTIQIREGYNPCFGNSNGYCPQENCCFRGDCLP